MTFDIEIIGVEFNLPVIHIMFHVGGFGKVEDCYSQELKSKSKYKIHGLDIYFDSVVLMKEGTMVHTMINGDHHLLTLGIEKEII